MNKIYILKHQVKDFKGMFGHVWFENGRGSTSSASDAKDCMAKGCEDITAECSAKGKKPDKKAKDEDKKESEKTEKKTEKSKAKEKK